MTLALPRLTEEQTLRALVLQEALDAGWKADEILAFVPKAARLILEGSADGGERPASTDTEAHHVSVAEDDGAGSNGIAAGAPPSTDPQDPTYVAWVQGHRQAGASPMSDQGATPADPIESDQHRDPPSREAPTAGAPPLPPAQLSTTTADASKAGSAEIPERKPMGWWDGEGRVHLRRFADEGKTMEHAAGALKSTKGVVARYAHDFGISFHGRAGRKPEADTRPLRRFTDVKPLDPESVTPLPEDHPAIVAGRTVFLKSVEDPATVDRVLVSGQHSRKLGDRIIKGAWAGMPIYTLTLEERATCPSSCHVWNRCYGNGMPFARRHAFTPALIDRLEIELAVLNEQHAKGFAVRLHNLGDFATVDYAVQWVKWLNRFERLHVFGYTAHQPWAKDVAAPPGASIGDIIKSANRHHGDRWFIRFSSPLPGPGGATTIWRKPEGDQVAEGIVCPAQTGKTECCGTCALCWEPNARDKCIVFVGHGNKHPGRTPEVTIEHVAQNKLAARQLPPDAPAANGHKLESTETREVLPKAVERRCEACPATFNNTRMVDQTLCLACIKKGVKAKKPALSSGMGGSLA